MMARTKQNPVRNRSAPYHNTKTPLLPPRDNAARKADRLARAQKLWVTAKAAHEQTYPADEPYPVARPTTARPLRRQKAGTRALQEIRHYQTSGDILTNPAKLFRWVRRIAGEVQTELHLNYPLRFQQSALNAIQVATEAHLVAFFESANLCALHAKRVTVQPKDFVLVKHFITLRSAIL